MTDFAEELFSDIATPAPPKPLDEFAPPPAPTEFYPGSRRKLRGGEETREPVPSRPPESLAWDRSPKRITFQGVEREFFTIGALAEALNRKPVTIRSWEAKGVMPIARYRGKGNRRLYSRRQIEGLVDLCRHHDILDFTHRPEVIPEEFTADVIRLWKAEAEEAS